MKDNMTSSKSSLANRLNVQDNMGCRLSGKSSLDRGSVAPAQLAATSSNNFVNNTGLPDNIKTGVERLSGYSMDDVKVHYNSPKPAELQAHAYAQGTDIHVAPGQEQHMAHEAWHVVQQKQGRVKPIRQLRGKTNINDEERLEHEADIMGGKAAQLKCADGDCDVCENCKAKKKDQQAAGNIIQKVSRCRGTNRIGNLDYPGTPEHILIQQHYLIHVNPMAEMEYLIPASGPNGGTGYADLVDPMTGGIYEIKFFPFAASAIPEVARYVTMAYAHCDENKPWHPGVIYPHAVLPFMGNKELVTFLHAPGVIAYYLRNKQREPKPEQQPVTEPVPVTEQIKRFVRQVLEEGMDAEQAAEEWLRGNPEIAWVIIGLGIAGIIALLADDLSGVGVADDVAIPPIAILIRVAWRFAI